MAEIEFQIQGVVLIRADQQRRDEIDADRHREIGRCAAGVLNAYVGGRNGGGRRRRESGFRIGRRGQHDVARIAADREHGTRISTDRYADIAEDFGDLIELRQVYHRGRRGCGVHGDIATAALRHQCDGKYFDADRRPIFAGGIADEHGNVGALRRRGRCVHRASAGAAAAGGEQCAGETDRQQSRLVREHG